jgi:hypothetical protein
MRCATIAVLALLLPLAACGGGMSADDYRERLDAACARQAEDSAEIPQTIQDRGLDIAAAEDLARDVGERFEDALTDLDPPSELEDAHQALLDAGDAPPPSGDDQEAVRQWTLRFAEIYDDLGAKGCAAAQRRVADEIASG